MKIALVATILAANPRTDAQGTTMPGHHLSAVPNSLCRLALSAGLLAGAGLGLTAQETLEHGLSSGLRLDISLPIDDLDILDREDGFNAGHTHRVSADDAWTVELYWHSRTPCTSGEEWTINTGIGLATTYQYSGHEEITFIAPCLRYHLGVGYQFTRNIRFELVPYIGLGLGFLDLPDNIIAEPVFPGLDFEFGAQLGGMLSLGPIDIGGGVSYDGRRNKNEFDLKSGSTWRQEYFEVNQDVFSAYFSIGWVF